MKRGWLGTAVLVWAVAGCGPSTSTGGTAGGMGGATASAGTPGGAGNGPSSGGTGGDGGSTTASSSGDTGGIGGSNTASSSGGTGGSGGGTGGSGGGTGGTGGGTGGTGGGGVCTPGATMPCYGGPPGTAGVGICQPGIQTCDAMGAAWGPCAGEITPAIEDCMSAADESCDGAPGCTCAVAWQKTFPVAGGTGTLLSVVVDGTGHLLVAGSFSGSVDLGGGPLVSAGGEDIFLARLDAASGALLWAKRFGGPGDDIPRALAGGPAGQIFLSATGTFDVGGTPLSGPILLLDPSGAPTFQQSLEVADLHDSGRVYGAAFDPQGNVYAVGSFNGGTMTIGTNGLPVAGSGSIFVDPEDGFIARLDGAGTALWADTFGSGDNSQAGTRVAFTAGDVYMFGRFEGSVDLGGTLLAVGVAGNFLARLSTAGAYAWAKSAANGSWPGGNEGLAGSPGGLSVLLPKDVPRVRSHALSDGAVQWTYEVDNGIDPYPTPDLRGIGMDDAGNVGVTGKFTVAHAFGGPAPFDIPAGEGANAFFLKLAPAGTFACAFAAGTTGTDIFNAVTFDAAGNAYAGGDFDSWTSLVLLRVGP